MAEHEWRQSLLEGKRRITITPVGLIQNGTTRAWADLHAAGFVRYQGRGAVSEELALTFRDNHRLVLKWQGDSRTRGNWQAMLLDLAAQAERQCTDVALRDGPDAEELRTARWIGIGVGGIALTVMTVILLAAQGDWVAIAVAVWLGVIGSIVGAAIFRYYTRNGPPPEISWADFARREGQSGYLPPN